MRSERNIWRDMEMIEMPNEMENHWVSDRLASLEPEWTPNLVRGRSLIEVATAPRRTGRIWAVATAALALAVIAIPQTRAIAQELWLRVLISRVEAIRVDHSRLPVRTEVTSNGPVYEVRDIDEAQAKAGFRPTLPPSDAAPRLAVTGTLALKQTVRVKEIESALEKAGLRDVHVPAEWEGVTLRTDVGPMITADYPGGINVLQVRPFELLVPRGFDLEKFAEIVFRSVGVSWWEARLMGRRFAANPAWYLDIPADEVVNIQEFPLPGGPAMLIEDFDDRGGVERATVVYTTRERIYAVSSPSRETSMRVAESLP